MKAFPPKQREGVYRAILTRREVTLFLPDPIPDALLARLLNAARSVPAIEGSERSGFIVIADPELRRRVGALLRIPVAPPAKSTRGKPFASGAGEVAGILGAPLHLCVTCDLSGLGRRVSPGDIRGIIGICGLFCAIENLWLAARSEGIGVAWVRDLRIDRLKELLGIPASVLPVAYLCLGYAASVADRTASETRGAARGPEDSVHADRWGRRGAAELLKHLRREELRRVR